MPNRGASLALKPCYSFRSAVVNMQINAHAYLPQRSRYQMERKIFQAQQRSKRRHNVNFPHGPQHSGTCYATRCMPSTSSASKPQPPYGMHNTWRILFAVISVSTLFQLFYKLYQRIMASYKTLRLESRPPPILNNMNRIGKGIYFSGPIWFSDRKKKFYAWDQLKTKPASETFSNTLIS